MKYVMCIVFCCLLCLGKAQQRVTGQKPGITAPPLELKLNPFYKKYLNANGIHIIASWRVPDSAMYAAHRTLTALTGISACRGVEGDDRYRYPCGRHGSL